MRVARHWGEREREVMVKKMKRGRERSLIYGLFVELFFIIAFFILLTI
jgi:flagellar biogenesis protein FliO